jgi:hypothetical protein
MEGLLFDIALTVNEPCNLTVYSDLHLDAAGCAHNLLKAHMDKRAALPNAVFVLIGDAGNWVMPRDEKRFMPSVPLAELAARDDYINEALDYHERKLRGYPWAFLGIGNHEHSVHKYHHFDVGRELAKRLDVPCGGYSGFARWRLHDATCKVSAFTLLYHHGFSAGQAAGVPPPALARWAAGHEGWDLCCYGHNHKLGFQGIGQCRMTDRGEIVSRDRGFVNTGSFMKAEKQGGTPDYSEVAGHPPVMIGAPLVRFGYRRSKPVRTFWSVEVGSE